MGVHVFGGGLSLGFEKYFTMLAHLEACKIGASTWKLNRPAVPIILDKTRQWPLISMYRGSVACVAGNPPCAPFSLSSQGARKRGVESDLAAWTEDVVRVGADLGAKFVVIESVRGALLAAPAVHDVIYEKYRSVYPGQMWALYDTADHGLPQRRPRVFWVLADDVYDLKPPPAVKPPPVSQIIADPPVSNHDPSAMTRGIYLTNRGRDDVLNLVPRLRPGQRMRTMKPADIEDVAPTLAEKLKTKHLRHLPMRLDDRAFSPVVYGKESKLVHPTEDRFLSFRELMRLCGFPDDFVWEASNLPRALGELGKGVCPPPAAWIAGEVVACLTDQRARRGPGRVVLNLAGNEFTRGRYLDPPPEDDRPKGDETVGRRARTTTSKERERADVMNQSQAVRRLQAELDRVVKDRDYHMARYPSDRNANRLFNNRVTELERQLGDAQNGGPTS